MASVELRPGDTLNIVWSSVQDTPLGSKEVESSFAFSYDELLIKLKAKGKAGRLKRVGTDGAKFSRIVALTSSALAKGRWSTGAEIDKNEVFSKLLQRFEDLDPNEYDNLTDNAIKSLRAMQNLSDDLSTHHLAQLKTLLNKLNQVDS